MRILAATVLTLALELLLGAAIFGAGACVVAAIAAGSGSAGRRRRAAWSGAGRALVRTVPAAVLLLAAASTLMVAGPPPAGAPLRVWVTPLPFTLAGALAAAGCWLVLDAGRREARGRWRQARRRARFGGAAVLFGVVAQLIAVWSDLLFRVDFRRAALVGPTPALYLALAMLSLGVSAFVGLVAGLAGKPRPAGQVAALLYLLGLAGLAAVAQAG